MYYKIEYVRTGDFDNVLKDTVRGESYTDAYVNAMGKHGRNNIIITELKQAWNTLYFGRVLRSEVQEAVLDKQWQQIRLMMKGMSVDDKYKTLHGYLEFKQDMLVDEHEMRMVHVRITNYVTALSRGGIIKPEDYR